MPTVLYFVRLLLASSSRWNVALRASSRPRSTSSSRHHPGRSRAGSAAPRRCCNRWICRPTTLYFYQRTERKRERVTRYVHVYVYIYIYVCTRQFRNTDCAIALRRTTYVKLTTDSLGLCCRTSTSTSEKYMSTRGVLLLDWVLRGL